MDPDLARAVRILRRSLLAGLALGLTGSRVYLHVTGLGFGVA